MSSVTAQLLRSVADVQNALVTPSPVFGLPWMDVVGVPRLSIALDQLFRLLNPAGRPSFVAEVFTILTLIFAGDLLIPVLWPSLPPSILLTSSTPYLLFTLGHALLTRTAVNQIVPKEAGLKWELLAAVPDGLTRAIVVCTFLVDNLVKHESLADNWFALVALTWIAVYGGALIVNAASMWRREWALTTPPEFRPAGWMTTDFWVPPVFASLYLYLTRPFTSALTAWLFQRLSFLSALTLPPALLKPAHQLLSQTVGEHRLAWTTEEARAAIGAALVAIFLCRVMYNFGHQLRRPPTTRSKVVAKDGKGQARKLKTQ